MIMMVLFIFLLFFSYNASGTRICSASVSTKDFFVKERVNESIRNYALSLSMEMLVAITVVVIMMVNDSTHFKRKKYTQIIKMRICEIESRILVCRIFEHATLFDNNNNAWILIRDIRFYHELLRRARPS